MLAALLIAATACGDNGGEEDDFEASDPVGAVTETTISARAALDPSSCNRALGYEVWDVVDESGAPIPDYTCQWTFDDGGSSAECAGVHEFSSAGFRTATVVVTDESSGAAVTRTTPSVPVYDPLVVDVMAFTPSCGLSFTLATMKSGGFESGSYDVDIQPAQNVLTTASLPANGTIEVSEPGTYTITVSREEEASALCTAQAETEISVVACP